MSGMSLYMELEQTCERLENAIAERDTALSLAVRLENENAALRDFLSDLVRPDDLDSYVERVMAR